MSHQRMDLLADPPGAPHMIRLLAAGDKLTMFVCCEGLLGCA